MSVSSFELSYISSTLNSLHNMKLDFYIFILERAITSILIILKNQCMKQQNGERDQSGKATVKLIHV